MITHCGTGLVNNLINKLPFELHIPGYSWCGPGTKIQERLARGDKSKNLLDSHCKTHDLAYFNNRENLEARHEADRELEHAAWQRATDKSASFGERAAAVAVTGIIKAKRKFGMGMKKTKKKTKKGGKIALRKIVDEIKKHAVHSGVNPIKAAVQVARKAVKEAGGKKRLRVPRVLPVPKVGGVLPLLPIFAALSAAGALSGGIANIAKAVNEYKRASKDLEESKRHNKQMEAIALGKGLYLRPYRKGLGLHFKPKKN